MDKIFLQPQYTIHYRDVHRADWHCDAVIDYTILFLLQGSLGYQLGNKEDTIQSDDILLINPGIVASASGDDIQYLQLTLSPSFLFDSAIRIQFIHTGSTVCFKTNLIQQEMKLSRLVINLVEELEEKDAGQEIIIGSIVDQIVIHLLRHYSNAKRAEELELSRVGLVDRRIRRAVELMHTHLGQDLPLEEIAAAAHLSPFHFARLFKKTTGTTPHVYLATLRTSQAKILLAETDLSITEVSSRTGYTSPSHFTKAFRQATGLTPREFRAALISHGS
jgi:AraC family transcriptional regulator